ncbi:hydrogenase maturation protease [Georgenia thermotolerans]|uniref:Hydrogenase maturation protease n=1 Tax=Georgenia thermotolerans TaxID=527326 RepID=A0A7J5UR02_9MICO|nr:hydrogenase maturation protease [Georgenia thermotolerans]KAE8764323.1 hydrogenase maturation protease [Georgenia thermotolerans]
MTVLVAGIGNVFLGDDAFGVEVVRRLAPADVPAGVEVADYGIRGIHLAYELLDGRYDTLVLVDAVPLGQRPGTLAVLDATGQVDVGAPGAVDAHAMSPDVVLAALRGLGGSVGRVLVVGCQPQVLAEGMGLSAPVRAAVERAVPLVLDVAREAAGPSSSTLAPSPGSQRRPVR